VTNESFFTFNAEAADDQGVSDVDIYGEEPFNDEDYQDAPAESDYNEAPTEEGMKYKSTDESYLDDLINDDPVIEEASQPQAEEATEAVSDSPPAAKPINTASPTEPSYKEQPAATPSSPKQMYSASPDINLDEARIQESPDIPEFSHQAHIEDVGAECVQCHQTLFSESVRGYKVGPSMKEICSQCHNGTDAPAEILAGFSDEKKYVKAEMPLFSHTVHLENTEKCITCHKDTYGELKKIKTPPPMSDCMECHNNHKASGNCKVCHEDTRKLMPRSHTPRWVHRNGHGTRARYNLKKCSECHTDRECTECHRGQTSFKIHRPAYRFSHGMDARQRFVNCGYCHDVENNCAQCHMRIR
jgi:predicted CXXCH cytochrome family protein